ncbi:GNAT family N-acetyltransferase [Christiangramia portivictoriae]|uniref:GNAT family N-acetyltransferase n=1 Tax=Christiangramia portivictoriae TaxID=326069 RepID=UPI00042895C8|nr:GNAT family N-acetyltransferase [Christiangramia portivictoriae]
MEILNWDKKYAEEFEKMNLHWLNEFFYVEPHDEEVLGNPEKFIIEPGGKIFYVKKDGSIVACVALMKIEDRVFELTKMAVKPAFRGQKIGHFLIEHALQFAKESGWSKLIIYSNRKLANAIHLYRKYGFKEIPIEKDNPYARGDIKMSLILS